MHADFGQYLDHSGVPAGAGEMPWGSSRPSAIMGSMLQLSVRLVHADQVDTLRSWFNEIQTTRREEAIATLIDETVEQESAILVEVGAQHLLVYAMDVQDPDQARRSADSGKHPIDADHQRVLEQVLAGTPTHERILDISP